MARVDERLAAILAELGDKPPDDAKASVKKRYSELVSQAVAEVFAGELTNRRGDMLFEAVTLHRKFPYAVLAGFFILDHEAASDATDRRKSTFKNAHLRLKIFTGRADPAGRDEQYERLYVVLMNASSRDAPFQVYLAGCPEAPVSLDAAFDELLALVAERDPDFYELDNGALRRV
jgi:hypothetical protein